MLVNLTARMKNGVTAQGGINMGTHIVDTCALRAQLPEIAPTDPNCHNDPGLVTRVTGLASYTVPKIDVLLSTTFRSDQGAPLQANDTVPSAAVARSVVRCQPACRLSRSTSIDF